MRCSEIFRQPIGFVLIVAVVQPGAIAQIPGRSASEIVRHLTYQDRSKGSLHDVSCGLLYVRDQENQELADQLIHLGEGAIPELDRALNSLAKTGERSRYATNAEWLLYAYAKLKGASAYAALWRLIQSPKVDFLRTALDDSVALSLGLTSYVDSRMPLMPTFFCRSQRPSDALDLLIIAWEKNDRHWLESSLGPNAAGALRSMDWAGLQSRLRRKGQSVMAVGYRFQVEGSWSQPVIEPHQLDPIEPEANPEISTTFTGDSGVSCGIRRVKFILPGAPVPSRLTYLVDNTDLNDLISTITDCAAAPAKNP
jgi:hypothetical protein